MGKTRIPEKLKSVLKLKPHTCSQFAQLWREWSVDNMDVIDALFATASRAPNSYYSRTLALLFPNTQLEELALKRARTQTAVSMGAGSAPRSALA